MAFEYQDIKYITEVAFNIGERTGLAEIAVASAGTISAKTSELNTKYASGFNFSFYFSLRATPGFTLFTNRTPFTDSAQVNERRAGDNILLRNRSNEFGNDFAWKNYIDSTMRPNCYVTRPRDDFFLVEWR